MANDLLKQNEVVFDDNIINEYKYHWTCKIDLFCIIYVGVQIAVIAISEMNLRLLLWSLACLCLYEYRKNKYNNRKLLETEKYFIAEVPSKDNTHKVVERVDGIIEKSNGKIKRTYFDKNFIAQKEITQTFLGKKLGYCDFKIILKNKSKLERSFIDVMDDNTRNFIVNRIFYKIYGYVVKYSTFCKNLKLRYKILFIILCSVAFSVYAFHKLSK